jgi:hypothetical protein
VKLLGTIDSIDFSESEKERIGKSFAERQGRPFDVLTTKAPLIRDNDFWRRAQKTFHITGFRDGHPLAIQKVIAKALEPAKSIPGKKLSPTWPLMWPLYKKAVRLHVEQDAATLYELIRAEDFAEGPGTLTEQIFRSIGQSLPVYEASVEDARDLYQLWGFERTPHLDEILSAISIDSATVRRMVADGVSTVRREIASAIASTKADLSRQVEQQAADLALLKEQLQKTRAAANEATARSVESLAASKANKSPAVTSPWSGSDRRSKLAGAKQQDAERLIAGVEALQARIDIISRQMKDHRSRIESIESPTAVAAVAKAKKSDGTTAHAVIKKWVEVFGDVGVPSKSVGSSWILLELIRRSRVILTDKPQLLTGLLSAFPGGELRSIVASPVWISELDWKEGLDFVSEDVGAPRFLLISEFDVALQEAYLVPSLIAWMLNASPLSANRIVLVPADSELVSVSPRVLELATVLTRNAAYIGDMQRLGNTIVDSPPTLDLLQSGATILGYSSSKKVSTEDDLRQYAANYGVVIPQRILENFASVYEGLRAFLGARDAAYVARDSTLLPWVKIARGDAVMRTLQEALRTALDGD